jgi:Fe2+ transport system protein B
MKKTLSLILLALFLSCGTKTKTKSQSSQEQTAKDLQKEKDSIARIDSIVLAKTKIALTDIKEQTKSEDNTSDLETTTTDVIEIESKDPIYITLSDGRVLNVQNGRITKTLTTTTAKRQSQKIVEQNKEISERTKEKIDSINFSSAVAETSKEVVKEISEKQTKAEESKVKKTTIPFWIWLILILIILIIIFRKWLLIQFPFLRMFKRNNN